jgi:Tol biopolymer transport system component
MPLSIGSRLGPYEVVSALGAGGMGEVYRARDSKLGRDVAVKVLPDVFARDAARMARFGREAKLLASLNHTNIASIYGLEDANNTRALVMELAEGPTLAERIAQDPIPIEDALQIAKQMAEALEYAHEKGIIHRDLKPANVKVAPDDTVKVLDFGLAKALESEPSAAELANSPTISRMATQAGVLLGTAAYMSPEQAKGKSVDRRADIWAFGCVLYEMLTGKMAFHGDTVTDTLAAVIKEEPEWSRLPVGTPIRVRVLLQRCLQKDPKQRLRDIGDARISLDEVLSGAPEGAASVGAAVPTWSRLLPWALGFLAVAITGVSVWNLKPSPVVARPLTRTVINLPPGQRLAGLNEPGLEQLVLALSADGNQLAYVATTQGGTPQIYLRAMDSMEARPIPGTEGAAGPFFSPDGRWLGFFADGKLKKIPLTGGVPQTLADASIPLGASWGSQHTIVFSPWLSVLQQVPDGGGAVQALTRFEKGEYAHALPEFLPDGKAVLFRLSPSGAIAVQTIGTGEHRTLIQAGSTPRYASSGHLIYAQASNLMAAPFDPQRLEVRGTAVPVVQDVLEGQYSISATGSLAYIPGVSQASQSRLVWVNRNGAEQPLAAPPRDYNQPRLSPDGRQVAVDDDASGQVSLYDIARDTLSRFTFGENLNQYPVWTPDGKRIAFMSNKGGQFNIYLQMADGSGGLERLTHGDNNVPFSWSPNGQLLAFVDTSSSTAPGIWVLRMSDHKAQSFLQTPAFEDAPQFSPDGRWLAYTSNESGRREIYVRPYPGPGGKWQISTEGGNEPLWNRNGRELFYRAGDKMMAVDINTQPGFAAGKPRELFEGHYMLNPLGRANYDVSPDGQRFLMLKPVEQEQAAPTHINFVLNWTEELKRLVPTGKK